MAAVASFTTASNVYLRHVSVHIQNAGDRNKNAKAVARKNRNSKVARTGHRNRIRHMGAENYIGFF